MILINTKEYLMQALFLDKLIECDRVELVRLRNFACSVRAVDYAKVNVQGSPSNQLENCVVKILMLENKIADEINQYVDLKKNIRDKIMTLENKNEILVLKYKYLNFSTWREIAMKMNYSIRQVRRIHEAALAKIIVL